MLEGTMKQKGSLHATFAKKDKNAQATSFQKLIYDAMVAACFFAGTGGCLYTVFAPVSFGLPLLVLGVVVSGGLAACWHFSLARRAALVVAAVWLVGFIVLLYGDVIDGLKLTVNHLIELMGAHDGKGYERFVIDTVEEDHLLVATFFLVPLTVLFSLLCAFISSRSSVVLSLPLSAFTLFVAWFFAIGLYPWALGLLLLAQSALIMGRFGKKPFFTGGASGTYVVGQTLATLFAAIVVFSSVIIFSDGYEVPGTVKSTRESFEFALDNLRYGRDTSRGMLDGELARMGSLELSEQTALEVTMSHPESLWLRGFIGEEYTGMSWESTDPQSLYEEEALFYWLHSDGFYGQTQLADLALLMDGSLNSSTTYMSVENVGASSKNIYAPYEVFAFDSMDLVPSDGIGDVHLYSEGVFGNRSYNYTGLYNQVKRYPDLLAMMAVFENSDSLVLGAYDLDESYYAKFVFDRYLVLNDETSEQLDTLFASYLPEDGELTFAETKQAVISCLTENIDYTTSPASMSENNDIIGSFLTETQEGYSVHYASAATVMFRYAGVPARYVEGYLITPEDVEGVEDGSTIVLDGTHAHAWVEVYLDRIGWIPVEVTPPYLGLMEEPDSYEGVPGSATKEPDEDAPETEDEDELLYENLSLEDEETEATALRLTILYAFILFVVLLLLVLVMLWLRHRRKVIRDRAASFVQPDNTAAVIALFSYGMRLLNALGLRRDNILLIDHLYRGMDTLKLEAKDVLGPAFDVYEKAVYSDHVPSDEQKALLIELVALLKEEAQKRCRGFKAWYVRFILCLY